MKKNQTGKTIFSVLKAAETPQLAARRKRENEVYADCYGNRISTRLCAEEQTESEKSDARTTD